MDENKSSGKKRNLKPIIIAVVMVVIVAGIGGGGFYVYKYINELKQESETGIKSEPNVFFNDEDAETAKKVTMAGLLQMWDLRT